MPPTYTQAGVYTQVAHYLKSDPGGRQRRRRQGRRLAAQDKDQRFFMTKEGWLREDSRVMREHMFRRGDVSGGIKYPFDYFKILATIPADQAFRSLKGGGCPLVHGLTAEAEAASGRVRERQLHPLSDRLVEERPGLFRAARRRSLMSLPNK